jgi:hypothetical protein
MRAALFVVAALALAACGRSSGYPPEYELNFMRACEARSAVPGLCACTWDKIEEGVSVAEFTALETMPAAQRQSHPTKLRIDQFALACARELAADAPAKD